MAELIEAMRLCLSIRKMKDTPPPREYTEILSRNRWQQDQAR